MAFQQNSRGGRPNQGRPQGGGYGGGNRSGGGGGGRSGGGGRRGPAIKFIHPSKFIN